MRIDKRSHNFDDGAKEAAECLLEQFWILRDREPEKYQLVRQREQVLRTYFLEKLGFRLILHRHFAKLEKIPAEPEPWMGIQYFKHIRDYVLFSCLLAYLESRSVDEQFLLSELCENIQGLYPETDEGLDWTRYEHRKSLVRVLQFSAEIYIIKVVDGDISQFSYAENNEVLYEVPLVARYFMRSFPKDLYQFNSKAEILEAEWIGRGEFSGINRRHRVYRKLFLSPAMYRKEHDDADFQYLRQYRHRIREDIEKHTNYQFELYKNTALLTVNERKANLELFPDTKAISDIALQFAALTREKRLVEDIPLQYDGSIYLTQVEYKKWIKELKEKFGNGWSKYYRDCSVETAAVELLNLLNDWKMAFKDEQTGVINILPLLARVIGRYPLDFKAHTLKGESSLEAE